MRSFSPAVPCSIYHLLSETSSLEVLCCMYLGKKTLLEMCLKETSQNIIVHSNTVVLLLIRCYVLQMKVIRETSRHAEFHQLLVFMS